MTMNRIAPSMALASALIAGLLAVNETAYGQDHAIDANVYYKLTTQFRGRNMPLDVFNGGPSNNKVQLRRADNVSGQFWRFVRDDGGFYRLTTQFRGPNMCLDIDPGPNQPELRPCGNFSGQLWRLTRAQGGFRLTTQFRGTAMCLDVEPSTNQPELRACGNFTGQFWSLVPTDSPVR